MYATVNDIEVRCQRVFSDDEKMHVFTMIEDSAVIIDAIAKNAPDNAKRLVTCNMIIRAINANDVQVPIGAMQGSMSANGYSQSWTMGNGSYGELYLSKTDKTILGVGNKVGMTAVPYEVTA